MNVPPFSNMTFNANLPGSTSPGLYKNKTDKKWIIKKGSKVGGFNQTIYESLANDIYEAVGIPVPKHKLDKENKVLILEYINGKTLYNATPNEYKKAKKELCKGFVVDALLANWDVIGFSSDNILLPNDGGPAVRIDNGGTFMFKATGGKKPFGKIVIEIDTMRNAKTAPLASKLFGELTDEEINNQIKTLIEPNYHKILKISEEYLPEIMKYRLDNLISRVVWVNAATEFKNSVEETATPEYMPQIQKALVDLFRDGFKKHFFKELSVANYFKSIFPGYDENAKILEFVNKTLIDNQAIVSGVFLLKTIGVIVDDNLKGIGIYVPTYNIEKFGKVMRDLFDADSLVINYSSDLPKSYFEKNNVLSVYKYAKNRPVYTEMYIMEVSKNSMPINVVKNSDLTFCENWYDGKMVYMNYPDHVKTKNGFLENQYLNLYFMRDEVTIIRLKKYISYGFHISINNPSTKQVEDITNQVEDITEYGKYMKNKTSVSNNEISNNDKESLKYVSTEIIENPKNKKINIRNIRQFTPHILSNKNLYDVRNLNSVEIASITYYSGTGHNKINKFLYSNNIIDIYNDVRIFRILMAKFPILPTELLNEYNKKILYYYFVNLYNAIYKGPKLNVNVPFIVYRGTRQWYLVNNKNMFYYMNSFVSTTKNDKIIKKFGNKFYIFYIHPMCNYLYIKSISSIPCEDEIVLSPYHRYLFVGENENTQHYVVLPCDLDIPKTYETFISWKDSINNITAPITGGRTKITKKEMIHNSKIFNMNRTRKINILRNNLKTINMNIKSTQKMNNTSKVNKSNNLNESNNKEYIKRLSEPIPSFKGKPPTPTEMEVIKKIVEFFDKK